MKTTTGYLVCGVVVQHDASGQGHCWRRVEDLPANVEIEIEGEIIDGGRKTCGDFWASNGQHYRWGK